MKKHGFLMGLFVLLLGVQPVMAASAQPQPSIFAAFTGSQTSKLVASVAPPDIAGNGSVIAPPAAINTGSGAGTNETNTTLNQVQQHPEMRAAWVSTVFNIDWPSKAGLSAEQQKAEYIHMLDELKATGMNSIIVQVRPESDAIYPSKLVPWSKWLTGTQGKDPGYDPLAFMVEETHKRGMKFHAWFNPFRASTSAVRENLVATHPARVHPNWAVVHNNLLIYNPGLPEVRKHIIAGIMEVVNNYNIDGVHLDDYFYPYGKEDFKDDAAFAAYNQGRFTNKGDWRRDNVNVFVRDLYQSIKSVKPQVEFGISPFGIWRNAKDDPTGSDTNGQSSYDNLYADVRTWIRNGWMDYVAPQLYWSIGYKPAAYDKLVHWWSNETNGTPVKLYIGQGAYRVGSNTTDWASSQTIIQQLQFNKAFPQVQGSIFFSAKTLMKDTAGIRSSLKQYYSAQNQ
ncbi:family 10 glycosylhydrolase [Brevibacillus ruminantium]|uniref:Family 10 glycosylhydrolase n=1 Tax=Brevibacillus ruminantium TaxID=2950604 RepID=A0ABY4WPU2_9BACL|nr:family 10 glycosylhydrolase [Brevibacillus ruminantium]USG66656.1 family 10 glycosylhydrolase [Brevibacillus ruminantium]